MFEKLVNESGLVVKKNDNDLEIQINEDYIDELFSIVHESDTFFVESIKNGIAKFKTINMITEFIGITTGESTFKVSQLKALNQIAIR